MIALNETKNDASETSETTQANAATATAAPSQNLPPIPKHTDQELAELTKWINEMSQIGSLCIKYTYLRELQLRHRPKQLSANKETIVNDQKWTELMRKIQANILFTNENEYMAKWFDTKVWRQAYFKFVRDECRCTEPDSVWTFDFIQFPYLKGVVHTPENDYVRRPRNYKTKISVIFAFNAAGDYMEPYFVYPTSFQENEATSTDKECFSHNGYVTSRTFEQWLNAFILTQLSKKKRTDTQEDVEQKQQQQQQESIALLYCAKLAVFDSQNLNFCKQNNVKPFGLTGK